RIGLAVRINGAASPAGNVPAVATRIATGKLVASRAEVPFVARGRAAKLGSEVPRLASCWAALSAEPRETDAVGAHHCELGAAVRPRSAVDDGHAPGRDRAPRDARAMRVPDQRDLYAVIAAQLEAAHDRGEAGGVVARDPRRVPAVGTGDLRGGPRQALRV